MSEPWRPDERWLKPDATDSRHVEYAVARKPMPFTEVFLRARVYSEGGRAWREVCMGMTSGNEQSWHVRTNEMVISGIHSPR